MATAIIIESCHDATVGGAPTDVTSGNARFKRADNDTADNLNPIPRPTSGSAYSWRKTFRIKVTTTPDGNVSNLRWFTDGISWGTGVRLFMHSRPVANYTQGSIADNTTPIGTGGGSAVADGETLTGSAPLVMNSGAQILANPSTGYGTQDILECQLEVMSTATRGPKPASGTRTITARVDEV